MGTRKIKDARDLETGEKIYLKGHAKATYMSNGVPVEDAIKDLQENGGGSGGGTAELMVNVTYDELVALRDNSQLVPGQKYRMTDYETMTSTAGTQSAGHPFDLILTAIGVNALDEKCSAIHSARDTEGYFANSKLELWELRYCLDNDLGYFAWAVNAGTFLNAELGDMGVMQLPYAGEIEYEGVTYAKWSVSLDGEVYDMVTLSSNPSEGDEVSMYFSGYVIPIGTVVGVVTSELNGKGVIYRMVDENENDIPYDFKNIMFTRKLTDGELDLKNGVDTFVYTFNWINDEGIHSDRSLVSGYCSGNKMVFSGVLNDTVFLCGYLGASDNKFGSGSIRNTFGDNCNDFTFGYNCMNNTFGGGCSSNTFGSYCCENKVLSNLMGLKTGNDFKYNEIGQSCYNCTFGEECTSNTLGPNFRNNHFGDSCTGNVFGHDCRFNQFGDLFSANTFGNYFEYNESGSYCSSIEILSPAQYNRIDSGCRGIKVVSNNTDPVDRIQYYHITGGVSGEIQGKLNRNYETKVAMNSNGELKVYCEADLVN